LGRRWGVLQQGEIEPAERGERIKINFPRKKLEKLLERILMLSEGGRRVWENCMGQLDKRGGDWVRIKEHFLLHK